MLRLLVVVPALFGTVLGTDQLPQDFADAFGAKCLNGDPPSYELSRNASETRWVLFLEGGGWCYGATPNDTKKSCAGRAGFVWPPSSSLSAASATVRVRVGTTEAGNEVGTMRAGAGNADIGGVMSQDASLNPDFYTWNKVFIHYCDGASFGGAASDPVAVSTRQGQPGSMWLRGRAVFDAMISYLQLNLGMGNATEVILSGGSAGGLAVFYNLDHLSTLLPEGVRLTGFPDAGFFLDGADAADGVHKYRNSFIGADPVWNVTGGGGTNTKCLADQKAGEEWKCLMAPYLAKYIETPMFVMNSAYDAWQMGNILGTPCLPAPNRSPCTANQNATLRAYRDKFVSDVGVVTAGKPRNGVYIDGCYVHEQNVNYCSGQGMPNCVGWSPLESGSKKWGYSTSVAVPDGRKLTPQEAFGAYYRGDTGAAVAVDGFAFLDNPSCFYRGAPVPPAPSPPPPPSAECAYFGGGWIDNSSWFTPVHFTQSGCSGTWPGHTYSVNGTVLTADKAFFNGLSGELRLATGRPGDTLDVIQWANADRWERNCSDFSGSFSDPSWPAGTPPAQFTQLGCSGTVQEKGLGLVGCNFSVHGDRLSTCSSFHGGLTGILDLGASVDTISWSNGVKWQRAHASAPTPPPAPTPAPSPSTITCAANHTPCAAHYATSGEGCCVHPEAVCCPNHQTCCPAGTKCVDGGGVLTQCVPTSAVTPVPAPTPGTSVCKPGAQQPFSSERRNIIVLGDSVSIGYTPPLAANLSDVALVQHSPFDHIDGGAEDTAYGVSCLEYFLKDPSGELLEPDVLMFNFGLHDGPLGNDTVPGQQGNSTVYPGELEQIVVGLKGIYAASKTKLLFALTSPMLCNVNADGNVRALNNQASAIMQKHGIPTLDNHSPIVQKCGAVPTSSCFSAHNCFCPHCSGAGYSWLAENVIAPELRKMLNSDDRQK